MSFEITGKIQKILPAESGITSDGREWKKQVFVIITEDERYPKNLAFTTWNELVNAVSLLKIGDRVKVFFRIESREFSGRWFTDLKAWKIKKLEEIDLASVTQDSSPETQHIQTQPTAETNNLTNEILEDNDIPISNGLEDFEDNNQNNDLIDLNNDSETSDIENPDDLFDDELSEENGNDLPF